MYGRVLAVEGGVGRFLPAFGRQALAKISLRIHEADADERDAQIAGFFTMVAGQDAEAAAINGNRRVEAKFGREVGDARRRVTRARPG